MDHAMSSMKTGSKVQTLSKTMPPHLQQGSLLPRAQWKSIQRRRNPRLSKSEWLAIHGEAARQEILQEMQRRRELAERERQRQRALIEEQRLREEQAAARRRALEEREYEEAYEDEYEDEYDELSEEEIMREEREKMEKTEAEEREREREREREKEKERRQHSRRRPPPAGKSLCLEEGEEDEKEGGHGGGPLRDLSEYMKYGRIDLDPPRKPKLSQIEEARDKVDKAFRKHEAMKEFKFDPDDDFMYEKRLWDKDYIYKKPWLVEELLLGESPPRKGQP